MKTNHTPQKVVFRILQGEVIALLCHSAKDCNPGRIMSYMHVGQHSEACRHIGQNLRLATPEQYGPLQRELAAIYETEIVPVKRLVA